MRVLLNKWSNEVGARAATDYTLGGTYAGQSATTRTLGGLELPRPGAPEPIGDVRSWRQSSNYVAVGDCGCGCNGSGACKGVGDVGSFPTGIVKPAAIGVGLYLLWKMFKKK